MIDGKPSVLVVCQGNVHRSALGGALLQTWADWYLPAEVARGVVIGSAGLGAPEGARVEAPVLAIAESLGADASDHRARQISDEMIAQADLVLTASRRQRDAVIQRVPGALRVAFTIREAGRMVEGLDVDGAPTSLHALQNRVAVLASLARRSAEDDDDIGDPEGHGLAAFTRMTFEEVPALARLGAFLFGMPAPDLDAYLAAAEAAVAQPAGE